MICQNCGKQVGDNASFCGYCGAKLIKTSSKGPFYLNDEQPKETLAESKKMPAATQYEPGFTFQGNQSATGAGRRRPTIFWIVLIEAIVLVFLVVQGIGILKNSMGPEKAAEAYFQSLVNEDYDAAYDALSVDQSEFLNETTFKAYCASCDFGNVVHFEAEDLGVDYSEIEVQTSEDQMQQYFDSYFGAGSFEEFFGQSSESDSESSNQTDSTEATTVEITYYLSGDTATPYTYYIEVEKTGSGLLGLVDEWTVSDRSMTVSDYHVIVPSGATIAIDGLDVSAAYITKDTDDTYYAYLYQSGVTDRYVVYNLPEIFAGEHTITVKAGEYATSTYTDTVYSDDSYVQITELSYDAQTMQSLHDLAAANVKTIYQAAASGADFSTIASLFTTDESTLSQIQADYEYLVSQLADSSIISLTIDQVDTYSAADSSVITMTVSYTEQYQYDYWWHSEAQVEDYSGSFDLTFTFTYENGAWVQNSLGATMLY